MRAVMKNLVKSEIETRIRIQLGWVYHPCPMIATFSCSIIILALSIAEVSKITLQSLLSYVATRSYIIYSISKLTANYKQKFYAESELKLAEIAARYIHVHSCSH